MTALLLAAASAPVSAQTLSGGRGLLRVSSESGDSFIRLGLLAQVDGRSGKNSDAADGVDRLTMRRLRPELQGRFLRCFEFVVIPDFGRSAFILMDAYVDATLSDAVRLRIGRAKTPFGFERLMPASALVFAERGFPSAIAPNRDVQVQVLGEVARWRVSYAASIGNGAPDGGSVGFYARGRHATSGRLAVRPFGAAPSRLPGDLTISIAVSTTNAAVLPDLRTAMLGVPFLSYRGASGDGTRVRLGHALSYIHGGFEGYVEYARSTQPIRRDEVRADVAHTAWQAASSYILTGEPVTGHGVEPRHHLDPRSGHWGALQVAVRYQAVRVAREALDLGLVVAGSSPAAEALTASANWYPATGVSCGIDAERATFDRAVSRPVETGIIGRVQLSF